MVHKLTALTDPTKFTEYHARQYRDYLLDTVVNTTLKTLVRRLRARYEVGLAEEWIIRNPFDMIKLRFIKDTSKKKEVVMLGVVVQRIIVTPPSPLRYLLNFVPLVFCYRINK